MPSRASAVSSLDAVTKAIIETNGAAGFVVELGVEGGREVATAVSEETDERFVVRSDDLYETVVELAQQCGVELEDG